MKSSGWPRKVFWLDKSFEHRNAFLVISYSLNKNKSSRPKPKLVVFKTADEILQHKCKSDKNLL